MRGDIAVGDIEYPALADVDDDATVELAVTDPTGVTTDDLTATVVDGTATADLPVAYNLPGRWVLTWTVTAPQVDSDIDPAVDVRIAEVYVVPLPSAGWPPWSPGRSRVANYVPHRTLAVDSTTHELTFTSTTRPTGVMVDRLIADGVAWVVARTGALADALHDQGAVAAALWAAAAVERGYPDEDDDALRRADQLQKLAESARADLIAANAAAGEPPVDAGSALLPRFAYPDPPRWGDLNL